MYGVAEEEIKKNPEGLNTFIELLFFDIWKKIQKCIGCSKD